MSDDDVSRRETLQMAGVLVAGGLNDPSALPSLLADESTRERDTIPAPFDTMPTIDDPTDEDREYAAVRFPPRAVPDEGPVPDYHHDHTVTRNISVPEWAIETVCWQLQHADDPDRWRVEELLMDYVCIDERFVTPDGSDAGEVVLDRLAGDESEGDGGYETDTNCSPERGVLPVSVTVDLPEQIYEEARDRADHAGEPVHSFLLDYINLEFTWRVNGEVVEEDPPSKEGNHDER